MAIKKNANFKQASVSKTFSQFYGYICINWTAHFHSFDDFEMLILFIFPEMLKHIDDAS